MITRGKNALIFEKNAPPNSVQKCMEIIVWKIYVWYTAGL